MRAIVNKDGSMGYLDIPEMPTDIAEGAPEQYPHRVAELIHERYTYDAEAAMAAKHRRCYIGLCSEEEAETLKSEAIEFEKYREQCKIQARKDCGIIQ